MYFYLEICLEYLVLNLVRERLSPSLFNAFRFWLEFYKNIWQVLFIFFPIFKILIMVWPDFFILNLYFEVAV